jgi:hypothetical protein
MCSAVELDASRGACPCSTEASASNTSWLCMPGESNPQSLSDMHTQCPIRGRHGNTLAEVLAKAVMFKMVGGALSHESIRRGEVPFEGRTTHSGVGSQLVGDHGCRTRLVRVPRGNARTQIAQLREAGNRLPVSPLGVDAENAARSHKRITAARTSEAVGKGKFLRFVP